MDLTVRGSQMDEAPRRPLVIAHRALIPGVPENSRAGVLASAQAGADIIELDLRGSLDNVPFLIHDPTLARTATGRGPIRLMPSSLVRRVHLRDSGETLPPFDEIVELMPAGLALGLHLKESRVLQPVLAALDRHGLIVTSWLWLETPRIARLARQLAPEIMLTLIDSELSAENAGTRLPVAAEMGAQAVSPDWRQVNPALLRQAHDLGLRVFSVYPDNEIVPTAVRDGIDGIITDDPAAVRAIINSGQPG